MKSKTFRHDDCAPSRIRYFIVFLVLYAIWVITDTVIGEWAGGRTLHTLSTPLEAAIPFVPEFAFIYVLGYVVPFAPILVVRDKGRLNRLIFAFILMNAVAFSLFILYPVYCPRPAFEVDSVATYLLSLEHTIDKPVNNFPSLHVAIVWLLFLGCRGYTRWFDLVLLVLSVGMSIAAVCVKQHYIADVAAGAILAWCTYALVKQLLCTESKRLRPLEWID